MSSTTTDQTTARIAETFRGKNRLLATGAVGILEAEHPMTLRQLFYRCISAGLIDNTQKEYKRVGRLTTRAREEGLAPWSWLVDHVRSTIKPSSWTGLADFGDTIRGVYRKDLWARQADHVEIFVEKDAVAGVLEGATRDYDVHLRVIRGYASGSYMHSIAKLWKLIRKPIHAYYLGDFDPSGMDLERDIRERLAVYSERQSVSAESEPDARSFRWTRLGVCLDDFNLHQLIRLPVKMKDTRARRFLAEHGRDCAELDALPPNELRQRVRDAVERHIDSGEWERLQQVEQLERESIEQFVQSWNAEDE